MKTGVGFGVCIMVEEKIIKTRAIGLTSYYYFEVGTIEGASPIILDPRSRKIEKRKLPSNSNYLLNFLVKISGLQSICRTT